LHWYTVVCVALVAATNERFSFYKALASRRPEMDNTRFRVKIYDFSARDLTVEKSSLYLRTNFDNYNEPFVTAVAKQVATSSSVSWPETIEFIYDTRHAARLLVKEFIVEVFERNTFSKDKLLGVAKVSNISAPF
jgi:hypothetical protein